MSFLRTIFAFAAIFLVVVSSSSFMVGVHFCSGDIKNLALFAKAEGCEKEQKLPPCHKHIAAPCCEDETIVHESEGFKASFSELILAPGYSGDFALPEVIVAEIIPASPTSKVNHFHNYDPPLRSHNLTVTHCVFLI